MTREEALTLFRYEDGRLFWRVRPSGRPSADGQAGGVNGNGYRSVCIDGERIYTHRIIFLMHNGFMPEQVDHIDGDITNNRHENLRAASHNQNMHNSRLRKDSRSGIKGVGWSKYNKAWRARVRIENKEVCVGYFPTKAEAGQAVADARNKLHREFANHGEVRT